ncbi:DUF3450 domain-containing protein [Nitrosomonas sp. Nm33]|uniref:DUF3450 domain-containing protein n=1 Tax=Nitrosomonas sp. Nm33 TaxID=133724 RepID=UPI00210A54BA|nr:DUF3450 domain-containing protein [Nitrosomonas sp. Nm33]
MITNDYPRYLSYICFICLIFIILKMKKETNKARKKYSYQNLRLLGKAKPFILIFSLFFVNGSFAETNQNPVLLQQYKQLLAEQEKKYERQRQLLDEQGKELERLRKQLDTLSAQPSSTSAEPSPPPSSPPQKTAATEEKPVSPNPSPSGPVGQAPPKSEEHRPPEMPRLSETVGGVLTRKGNIVVEPALAYSFSDNNRVFLDAFTFIPAIAVGLIDIRDITRHSLFASLGVRYGATNRLEFEARIPYVYRADIQRSRPVSIGSAINETFDATGNNIGDVELTARYQLTDGAGGWPILVANMVSTMPTGTSPFKIDLVQSQEVPGAAFPTEVPTGAGFFSFQPSITALYPTDPAVFFGNIQYTYTTNASGNGNKVDPGDAVGITFGMAFNINERSSFNLGYSHRHFFNTRVNHHKIGGSALDIGQLLLGYAFRYTQKTNFNLSVGIGATDNAQDVSLTFRVPITF